MELPKILPEFSEAKVAPKGKLNLEDVNKMLRNLLKFTGPALGVFFYQLSIGIDLKAAWALAALMLYGILADYFTKLNDGK